MNKIFFIAGIIILFSIILGAGVLFFDFGGFANLLGKQAESTVENMVTIDEDIENIIINDLKTVEKRVMEIFNVDRDVIYSKGRRRVQVEARSLLCYWAVRELGYSATELAKRLSRTQPAVGYAVNRGERIAKERKLNLGL